MNLPAEFHGAVLRQSDNPMGVHLYEFKEVGYIEVHRSLRALDVFFEDGVNLWDAHFSERTLPAVLEEAYRRLRNHVLLKIGDMRGKVELYQRMEERYHGYIQDLATLDGKNPLDFAVAQQTGFDFWCIVRGDDQAP